VVTKTSARVPATAADQAGQPLTEAGLVALLNLEARLLDENRLTEWLGLICQEVTYWVPLDPAAETPAGILSIVLEDRFRLEARVWRITEAGVNHSQDPPSRTVRVISNVELDNSDPLGPAARFVTVLFETRPGGQRADVLRTYPMRCEYRLRQESGQWRIWFRKTTILQADADLASMTFLV
jgi:3-phenylpropionate/cinnamic acid dioxygenase small subunit